MLDNHTLDQALHAVVYRLYQGRHCYSSLKRGLIRHCLATNEGYSVDNPPCPGSLCALELPMNVAKHACPVLNQAGPNSHRDCDQPYPHAVFLTYEMFHLQKH